MEYGGLARMTLNFFSWSCSRKAGIGQGVAPNDLELLNAVHEHVHSRNGRGDHVDLLPIELQGPVLLALVFEVERAVEQQAA